jgi:hypothetical protein
MYSRKNTTTNGGVFATVTAAYGIPVSISIALIMIIAALCAVQVSAQSACPDGTVPIGSDRATATANGIPTSSQCWTPSDKNIGTAAGDAKAWLRQHATSGANIACLNAQFAEKLKTFMEAVPGGIPTITDAYRGKAAQAQAQASGASQVGPCGSYHQYGLAADFNNSNATTLRWMRLNAPQYGLAPTGINPVTGCGTSGFCDPGHIQMAGPLPPEDQCGICNSTGNGVLPPTGGAQSPGAAILKAIGNFFNPSSNTAPANNCTAQSVCSGNVLMYQSATCTMTVQQTCTAGCANGACNQQSCPTGYTLVNGSCVQTQQTTSASNSSSAGNTSTPTGTSSVTPGTSTAALLQSLASSQGSAATPASNTPITLSGAAQDITQLSAPAGSNITYAQTGAPDMTLPTQGVAPAGSVTPQQPQGSASTFTSGDMSNTGVTNFGQPATGNVDATTLPLLAALKNEVLNVIGVLAVYIEPFGGVVPNHISSE